MRSRGRTLRGNGAQSQGVRQHTKFRSALTLSPSHPFTAQTTRKSRWLSFRLSRTDLPHSSALPLGPDHSISHVHWSSSGLLAAPGQGDPLKHESHQFISVQYSLGPGASPQSR